MLIIILLIAILVIAILVMAHLITLLAYIIEFIYKVFVLPITFVKSFFNLF